MSIPFIQGAFGWDKAAAGLMASGFFWAYASGQVVNGLIGDRVKPRLFVSAGLVLSGVCNVVIGFSNAYGLILALWTINGYCQSMLFGPMMRAASAYIPTKKHSRFAVAMTTTSSIGYLISYMAVGRLANERYWRAMYIAPGLLLIVLAAVWAFFIKRILYGGRNDPAPTKNTNITQSDPATREKSGSMQDASGSARGATGSTHDAIGSVRGATGSAQDSTDSSQNVPTPERRRTIGYVGFIFETKLWLIALVGLLIGIIKEGVYLWGPAFISETQRLDFSLALSFLSFVPILTLCCSLLIGVINRLFKYHEKHTMLLFSAVCSLSLTILLLGAGVGASAGVGVGDGAGAGLPLTLASFGMTVTAITGAGSLLTVFVPLNFISYNRVSTAAGFIDCAVYMGAALSGPLLGMLADSAGWNGALLFWLIISLISISLALMSRDYKKQKA